MPHVNKPRARNENLVQTKIRPIMNYERIGKLFRKKNPIQKIKRTVKIKVINACEQKTTSERANFCSNTVFSLYFKIRVKTMHAAKPLAFNFLTSKIMKMCEQIRTKTIHATKSLPFSLHSLFRSYQIYYSNLTSKIMKICEQISYLTNSA